ncbi:hypothetical protein WFJ45_23435, partial [Salmonella enterica subsp. enterica serovar Minnesota]|uniref:hypothetical protein n=1 Tax=Salmonella enterica TaxID=28901 RepID=UPI003D2D3274
AMTRALERPDWRRDAIALLAILVAVLARTQLVLLGPAFVLAAIVLQLTPSEAGGARMRVSAALRGHW